MSRSISTPWNTSATCSHGLFSDLGPCRPVNGQQGHSGIEKIPLLSRVARGSLLTAFASAAPANFRSGRPHEAAPNTLSGSGTRSFAGSEHGGGKNSSAPKKLIRATRVANQSGEHMVLACKSTPQ
jgi:hypothetical protein